MGCSGWHWVALGTQPVLPGGLSTVPPPTSARVSPPGVPQCPPALSGRGQGPAAVPSPQCPPVPPSTGVAVPPALAPGGPVGAHPVSPGVPRLQQCLREDVVRLPAPGAARAPLQHHEGDQPAPGPGAAHALRAAGAELVSRGLGHGDTPGGGRCHRCRLAGACWHRPCGSWGSHLCRLPGVPLPQVPLLSPRWVPLLSPAQLPLPPQLLSPPGGVLLSPQVPPAPRVPQLSLPVLPCGELARGGDTGWGDTGCRSLGDTPVPAGCPQPARGPPVPPSP